MGQYDDLYEKVTGGFQGQDDATTSSPILYAIGMEKRKQEIDDLHTVSVGLGIIIIHELYDFF